jgi:RNA polymerase sigma-70 factor, ECF subfamily
MHPVYYLKSPNLLHVCDEALVKAAKAGSDDSFQELMRRSWDQCLRIAISHLHDREDAVDEVQASFWKAYTHLHTYAEKANFSTWVSRIVINRCIMKLRANKRVKLLSFDHMAGVLEGPVIQDTQRWSDPEEECGSREVSFLVQSELRRVPKLLRTAVELHHLQGLSLEEIGIQLGINVGAVKTRVSRGNKYLRDRMTRHLGQRGVASLTR